MHHESPALIEINNATVYRGGTRVFSQFSLTIEQGECVAILGPNGAGKTTLLHLLSRQLYPVVEEGAWVKLMGMERFSVWDYRRFIGVVLSDVESQYFKRRTGLACVLTGFAPSLSINSPLHEIEPLQQEQALALMQRLNIACLRDIKLSKMSTGQQRRCLLARALVRQPAALIFDEPTAGLDFAASAAYLAVMREQIGEHRTVVVVTHHINEIPPEIERVVLLKQGQVLADGDKTRMLCDEKLSELYDTPVNVVHKNGYYVALPAG